MGEGGSRILKASGDLADHYRSFLPRLRNSIEQAKLVCFSSSGYWGIQYNPRPPCRTIEEIHGVSIAWRMLGDEDQQPTYKAFCSIILATYRKVVVDLDVPQ